MSTDEEDEFDFEEEPNHVCKLCLVVGTEAASDKNEIVHRKFITAMQSNPHRLMAYVTDRDLGSVETELRERNVRWPNNPMVTIYQPRHTSTNYKLLELVTDGNKHYDTLFINVDLGGYRKDSDYFYDALASMAKTTDNLVVALYPMLNKNEADRMETYVTELTLTFDPEYDFSTSGDAIRKALMTEDRSNG